MTREEKYDAVNQTTSLEELSIIIKLFADKNGKIQGRSRQFDAEKMAKLCLNYNNVQPNVLTREFGIRQQALMFKI